MGQSLQMRSACFSGTCPVLPVSDSSKPDAEEILQARERRLAQLRVHAHQSAPEPEREIIIQRESGDARRYYRLGKSVSLI